MTDNPAPTKEQPRGGQAFAVLPLRDIVVFPQLVAPLFVGRLPVVATLEDLDEAALMDILTKPKNALVKQYQRLFEMEDCKLTFNEDALKSVSKRAIQRKTGARGLRSIMEGILLDTMFELPALNGVSEVVINSEVVEGRAQPLYIYSDRRTDDASTA